MLPCPFCGGEDVYIVPDEHGSGGQHVAPYHIGCRGCGAEIHGDPEAEAIAAWNRRAASCKCGQSWEEHSCPGDGVEFSRPDALRAREWDVLDLRSLIARLPMTEKEPSAELQAWYDEYKRVMDRTNPHWWWDRAPEAKP